MKKRTRSIILSFATLLAIISTMLFYIGTQTTRAAEGWPKAYGGVMMQGFYWDSYTETQWTNLTSQADTLAKYVNAVWVPNSGYCNATSNNMGYLPVYWFNHKSAFGTEAELKTMVSTFKEKGITTIADVVINHKNGVSSWTDFAKESWTYNGETKTISWTSADICSTDECVEKGYTATGAADTGEDFNGGRDLDHTSANVQANVKIYLDFLMNEIGYGGFRYDMVKGYAPTYTGIYNSYANPTFSVGEYWDGNTAQVKKWIDGTKTDGVIQSAAFDFPLKYFINDAFGNGNWSALSSAALANDDTYKQFAVTFVDNHDTYRTGQGGSAPLNANIEAANAYILALSGTPCIFLRHWQMYNATLKKLCLLRNITGITNTSTILQQTAQTNGFVLETQGNNGKALLLLGTTENVSTDGYQLALEGTNFKYYVSSTLDISALNSVEADPTDSKIPAFCTMSDGETCAFFEVPSGWGSTIKCWMWDNNYNYTGGTWPGAECTYVGTASNGKKVYKWTLNENQKKSQSASNSGIIFNDGSNQTNDMTFVNGGYYTYADGYIGTVDGIQAVKADTKQQPAAIYDLSGRKLNGTSGKGLYIKNGKKFIQVEN